MPCTDYSPAERGELLRIARAAMTLAAESGELLQTDLAFLPPALKASRCTFVTLKQFGELRGCTGSLEATQELAADVAHATWRTALADPRFAPVGIQELGHTLIEISVLSPLTALPIRNEAHLLAQLQPAVDGLVLDAGVHRATFLPKVWEHLPNPRDFVGQLKQKAGLSPDFWSQDLRVFRYQTETITEAAASSRVRA